MTFDLDEFWNFSIKFFSSLSLFKKSCHLFIYFQNELLEQFDCDQQQEKIRKVN